jgi:hypothetical protein
VNDAVAVYFLHTVDAAVRGALVPRESAGDGRRGFPSSGRCAHTTPKGSRSQLAATISIASAVIELKDGRQHR